ncbi:hypothetical protein M422DRAFT_239343 [Sphaerobolus stellatus SS14]|nr:hypothetical protein M422DRAFT_239343 [Sphaerobolus stellatus SS14]
MFALDSDNALHSEFVPSPSELKSIREDLTLYQKLKQKYQYCKSLAAHIRRVPDEVLQMIQLLALELFSAEWPCTVKIQDIQSIYEIRGRLAAVCQR